MRKNKKLNRNLSISEFLKSVKPGNAKDLGVELTKNNPLFEDPSHIKIMKVICRAHKDSLWLVIPLGIIVCILPIVSAILLHDHKYIMLVFIILSVLSTLVFVLIIIRDAFTKDDIVIFDEGEKKFFVNRYLKKYCFTVSEISDFKYDNKGIGSLGPLIFLEEEFGSLIFILKKGEKIRTPLIDNVLEKYNEIKIIIDGDNK